MPGQQFKLLICISIFWLFSVSINCEEQKLAQGEPLKRQERDLPFIDLKDVGLDTVEEQVELKAGAERLPDDLDLEPQDGVHVIKVHYHVFIKSLIIHPFFQGYYTSG